MALQEAWQLIDNALKSAKKEYEHKFEIQENKINELEQEIIKLQSKNKRSDSLGQQIDEILDEVERNEQKQNIVNVDNINESDQQYQDKQKTPQFWKHLEKKLEERDIEFIKELVRTKQLKMDQCNIENGRNLLMYSAHYGLYELVMV